MQYIIFKYLITAGVVVMVSEFAKRSDKLGGLIAALPLVTVLTLIWLYVEHQPISKIANHAYYTFWYVLPTLPMFLLLRNDSLIEGSIISPSIPGLLFSVKKKLTLKQSSHTDSHITVFFLNVILHSHAFPSL